MTRQRRRHLIKMRRTSIGLALVLPISMVAGMVDAIGLLVAGDFVSFMSGNTTRAAVAVGRGDWHYGAILLGAVACFIVGNALGVIVAHRMRKRVAGLLGIVALVLCVAASLPVEMRGSVPFFLVVLAMGMVNATVEHVEGLPIGLTYVTGALSRFGRGLGRWVLGDARLDWGIQIVPWLGMLTGGIIGGVLALRLGQDALWWAAGFTLFIAIATFALPERTQARFGRA
ncbi:DUF1275 domain-containing protein [Thalassospira sp. MA62]|nr:DUF1275 domain-containing protein [Thalassospira sp. MA62]